jgi:hypothetical protein
MSTWREYWRNQPKSLGLISGLFLVAALWAINTIIDSELTMAVFYIAPVYLVTWFAGLNLGLVVVAASAAAWVSLALMPQPLPPDLNVHFASIAANQ